MIPWLWVNDYFMLLPEFQGLTYRVLATYFSSTFSSWVNVSAIKLITVVKVKHSACLKSLWQYAWVTLGTGVHCLPTRRTLSGQVLCTHGCPHSPQNSYCDMLNDIYSPSFVVLVCLFSLAAILDSCPRSINVPTWLLCQSESFSKGSSCMWKACLNYGKTEACLAGSLCNWKQHPGCWHQCMQAETK